MSVSRRRVLAAVLAAVVATSACASSDAPAVRSGPGVTASTISLGVLTDMSGPFAPTALIRPRRSRPATPTWRPTAR